MEEEEREKRGANYPGEVNGVMNRDETVETSEKITLMISHVERMVASRSPVVKGLRSPKLLIRALKELDGLVEMNELKRSVLRQVEFLLMNRTRTVDGNNGGKFENHMLHSVIYGPPGVGKTTVGLILAKIWMALGLIDKKEKERKDDIPVVFASSSRGSSQRKKIVKLEHQVEDYRRRMGRIQHIASKQKTTSSSIRKRLIRLRPGSTTTRVRRLRTEGGEEVMKEWDALLNESRDVRFGFDELIRESIIAGEFGDIPEEPLVFDEPDPYENAEPPFMVVTRDMLVGKYVGHTAPKTREVLDKAKGGVVFIDEAYSLYNCTTGSSGDSFGFEALNVINEYMSKYPDELIFVFAGYKDLLNNTIFRVQPGMMRRCEWTFEITGYSSTGLASILQRQLARNSWKVDPSVDLPSFLGRHMELFRFYGGDTEKLSFYAKLAYSSYKFRTTFGSTPLSSSSVEHDSLITLPMLEEAVSLLSKHMVNGGEKTTNIPLGMYT